MKRKIFVRIFVDFFPIIVTGSLILGFGIVYKQQFIKMLPCFISLIVLLLSAKANRMTFIIGAFNCIIYSIGYIMAGLFASTISALAVSMPMQITSFFLWKKNAFGKARTIKRLNIKQAAAIILCAAVLWIIFYYVYSAMGANKTVFDNTLFIFGIAVAVLVMLGYIENVFLNVISTIVNIALWTVMTLQDRANITYLIFTIYTLFRTCQACFVWIKLYKKGAKNIMQKNDYPNPQFIRENIVLLDGEWEFGLREKTDSITEDNIGVLNFKDKIIVPYCVESELSGIKHIDFIKEAVYQKKFFSDGSDFYKNTYIVFGAINYEACVYLNGRFLGIHKGGYTPFSFDIGKFVKDGENIVTVVVKNDLAKNVPSGKQSPKKESFGCFYTRSTGIWQSVWLERRPKEHLKSFRIYPNIEDVNIDLEIFCEGEGEIEIFADYNDKNVGYLKDTIEYHKKVTIKLSEKHLWESGQGNLYDLKIVFKDDCVKSYFGLREISYKGLSFILNKKPLFQRLVLDQGYYPEGIYTPKSPECFKNDIELAVKLGFNGARLHQKVFDPRFLYECDKAGFMVWSEMPSWGLDYSNLSALGCFLDEWREAMDRDFNHPSIITWCPLNEVWENLDNKKLNRDVLFIKIVYDFTKLYDPTRPCVDVSGGYHCSTTDVYDFHCYEDITALTAHIENLEKLNIINVPLLSPPEKFGETICYKNEPVNISEYGGMSFSGNASDGWGYGDHISNSEEFIRKYVELTTAILNCKKISGFCYTQLYDVEQEQNGLYTYDRKDKFTDKEKKSIKVANTLLAAIEII